MDLKRQYILRIEYFDQQRKPVRGGRAAKQSLTMVFHQCAQGFPGEWAVSDNTFIAGSIRYLPGLAYRGGAGQGLGVEFFDVTSAPNAFFEDRFKSKRVEHRNRREDERLNALLVSRHWRSSVRN